MWFKCQQRLSHSIQDININFYTLLEFGLTDMTLQPLTQMAMVCIVDFQPIEEQFLSERASNLDPKWTPKNVLVRLSYPLLVMCGLYVEDSQGKAQ